MEERAGIRNGGGATTLLTCLLSGGSDCGHLTELDWEEVIRQAEKHGVAPVLHERLVPNAGRVGVPARLMEALWRISFGSATQSLRLYRDLARLLPTLRAEGLDVIVLKGAFLAEVVYRNVSLRPMYDVDLLVRRPDLPRAEATLRGIGYRPLDHPKVEAIDYGTHHHGHPLVLPGGPPIELHWTIARPTGGFSIDVDGLWRRAETVKIGGVETLGLSPEDLLLHLCVHAAFDHRLLLGLRCFWDIRETIRHYDGTLAWRTVEQRAHEWGVGKYVYVALRLAKELVAAGVPDDLLVALAPTDFEPRLMDWARAEVLSEESVVPPVSPRLAQLWGTGDLQEKAALFFRSVFPSVPTLARMYAAPSRSWRIYLYYPVRWAGLVRVYGRSVVDLLGGREPTTIEAERQNARAALKAWLRS